MNPAKSDSERLMQESIKLAKRMLESDGEFIPYGAAMKPNGDIVSIAASDLETANPSSEDVIEAINDHIKIAADEGGYKATAVICNVTVAVAPRSQKIDAISVALDHRDYYSVIVYHPYRIRDGSISFDSVFASQGPNAVFTNSIH